MLKPENQAQQNLRSFHHQLQNHLEVKSSGPYRPNAAKPCRPENSAGYGAKLKPFGGLVPVHLNPSGDWVLSPGARHYPKGGVGHSSATMSIFLETKAPHESTLLDLCMVHMTCSSLQQLNIRYWSYNCTCGHDIQNRTKDGEKPSHPPLDRNVACWQHAFVFIRFCLK